WRCGASGRVLARRWRRVRTRRSAANARSFFPCPVRACARSPGTGGPSGSPVGSTILDTARPNGVTEVPAGFRVIVRTQFPFHAGAISLWRFAAMAAAVAGAARASGGGQATGRNETAARGLHGELAFVARGRLFLLGGRARVPRLVALPGIPFAPAWSADSRWLAVEVRKAPPAGRPAHPYPEDTAAR